RARSGGDHHRLCRKARSRTDRAGARRLRRHQPDVAKRGSADRIRKRGEELRRDIGVPAAVGRLRLPAARRGAERRRFRPAAPSLPVAPARRRGDAQRLCAAHDQGVRGLSTSFRRLTTNLPIASHIPFTSFAGWLRAASPRVFGVIREAKIMVKENPIHKQQIDPVLMSERFPYYDLDGQLAACADEIHKIIAGREEAVGRAYWDAFNRLSSVDRKVEGELYDSYIRGSARHTSVKYADAGGQEVATIACQNAHMARRVKLPLASVMSCIAESQRLTIEYIVEACIGDAERLVRLTSAVNRLALLEFDIMQRYAA